MGADVLSADPEVYRRITEGEHGRLKIEGGRLHRDQSTLHPRNNLWVLLIEIMTRCLLVGFFSFDEGCLRKQLAGCRQDWELRDSKCEQVSLCNCEWDLFDAERTVVRFERLELESSCGEEWKAEVDRAS